MFDSLLSYNDIGFIVTKANLPTPLWRVRSSLGVADPVNIYWLVKPVLSIEYLTAFHNLGVSFQSSISLGLSPSKDSEGLVLTSSIYFFI